MLTNTLTFADRQSSQTVKIPITADLKAERDERIKLTLTGVTTGAVGGHAAYGTIIDNDGGLTTTDPVVQEGYIDGTRFITTIAGGTPNGTVTSIRCRVVDGTATLYQDYTAVTGCPVTFPSAYVVTATAVQDNIKEPDETFKLEYIVSNSFRGFTGYWELDDGVATIKGQ